MLMDIDPPIYERIVGDDDDDDFPLREGSSPIGIAPSEGKSAPAQVPPRDSGASSGKCSDYFFLVKMTSIPEERHQRWAEEGTTHQGTPGPLGAHRWVMPTWWPPSGTYWLQKSSFIP